MDQLCLCVLPGSRKGEVLRHMEVFKETVRELQHKQGLKFCTIIPTLPHLVDLLQPFMADWPGPYHLIGDQKQKYDAMAACNLALAASGTVALELAMARLPCVIAYRINPITAAIVRKMIKVNYVHLLNILEDKAIVPERLMKDCRADILANDLSALLGPAGEVQIQALQNALGRLKPLSGESPSVAAANEILDFLKITYDPEE
jgi:lipid-A-disaccharide synthase